MDLFSVFSLFGGLAFFLYGMHVMTAGLEKLAGGKLERTLKKMTSNPFKSILLGAGITIAIQSSSALTVMLVGLVNSGIMQLGQTIGVIMGSNIGTTLTAWILSLSGIQSDNFFLRLLKPESFAPVFALIGIVMMLAARSAKRKDLGNILVGFSVLMFGMQVMGDAVSPLADMPEFASILTMFSNPLLGVLTGAVFTGVIQSSAASVGILQALSLTGGISYEMAIPIIMGQNIGTCVTALLSSIGVNRNAKRVAAVHICFNIIGTVVLLCLYYLIDWICGGFSFAKEAINPAGIAGIHSIFNILTTILLLPCAKLLEKLACLMVPNKDNREEKYSLLEERFLQTPAFAVEQSHTVTVEMADLAWEAFRLALQEINQYDEKTAQRIEELETEIDQYEDKLGTYLVKLSSQSLSLEDSKEISKLLHSIGNFERIGDHAVNLLDSAKEMHEKKIGFTEDAKKEMEVLFQAVEEIVRIAIEAFERNDLNLAEKVEPLEQVVDKLKLKLSSRHIERLQEGKCTIEMGFVHADILLNLERIADHCSNIAVCLIQTNEGAFDTHEYLHAVKDSETSAFMKDYEMYKAKYALPQA